MKLVFSLKSVSILPVFLLLFFLLACTSPADDAARAEISDTDAEEAEYQEAALDKEKSMFEFEGYGPGKSHIGTFDEWDGIIFLENGNIAGGRGTIKASSVNTGIGKLDEHLQRDDFFDAALYPEIRVESTGLTENILTAHLTFRGITKQISFPVEITGTSIGADFILDTTPFDMKNLAVNKEVRIAFEFVKSENNLLDETHPITKTMGCDPGDIENGVCIIAEKNNADIFGQIKEGSIQYENIELGFLAQPAAEGEYPGVVMIHEWWGLNENIKEMAMHLAAKGYKVLAVDLYGEVTEDAGRARELVTQVSENQEKATEKLKSAAAYLRDNEAVTIGSIGWCFGGGQSLQLAISEEDMDATVIYYGKLTSDKEKLSKINGPVLGVFAEEDKSIPPDAVNEFEDILNELNVENYITIYEGVDHAFANPSGSRFAPSETKDAWEKTVAFFDEHLN